MKHEVLAEGIEIYLGDCLEILPTLAAGSIDAVVTDPPYGINHSSSRDSTWKNTTIAGDSSTTTRDVALELMPDLPMAVFGTWKTQPIDHVRGVLVWDKGPAFGMGDLSLPWKPSWELVYVRGAGWKGTRDEGILRGHLVVSWETKGRVHPHQKPTTLIQYLLSKLPTAITILDPFMGSGTTGVACVKTGRRFIGIEIDENYYEIAKRRILDELAKPQMF